MGGNYVNYVCISTLSISLGILWQKVFEFVGHFLRLDPLTPLDKDPGIGGCAKRDGLGVILFN